MFSFVTESNFPPEPHSLKKDAYEELITGMLRRGTVLDHSRSPCEDTFIPDTTGHTYLLFIHMEHHKDYSTWLQVAKVSVGGWVTGFVCVFFYGHFFWLSFSSSSSSSPLPPLSPLIITNHRQSSLIIINHQSSFFHHSKHQLSFFFFLFGSRDLLCLLAKVCFSNSMMEIYKVNMKKSQWILFITLKHFPKVFYLYNADHPKSILLIFSIPLISYTTQDQLNKSNNDNNKTCTAFITGLLSVSSNLGPRQQGISPWHVEA